MKCWKCKTDLPDPEFGKILFRTECDHCGAALHCCCNCKYYHPGKPNDCEIPGTDYIPDRTKSNLCEEFRLQDQNKSQLNKPSVEDIENSLFGRSSSQNNAKSSPKDKFNSLFKDEPK